MVRATRGRRRSQRTWTTPTSHRGCFGPPGPIPSTGTTGGAIRSVFRPFSTTTWTYANTQPMPIRGDYISLPLATVAEPAADVAMSVVLSPEDTLLEMSLSTDESGAIAFTRTRHRLGGEKPLRFALDLVAHPADWRGGLGWLVVRYPQYFNPGIPLADELAGCGAYSGDENPIDAAKLRRMAFRVNWKMSDDFPYQGMFLPPLANPDEHWDRACGESCPPNKPRWISFRCMNDYAKYMRQHGFYVLNYFDVTDFGTNMQEQSVAVAEAAKDPELWKKPVAYLKVHMPNGCFRPPLSSGYYSWTMDPGRSRLSTVLAGAGEAAHRQAARHFRHLHRPHGPGPPLQPERRRRRKLG